MGLGDKLAKSGPKKWLMGCGVLTFLGCAGLGAVVLQVADFPTVAMRADEVRSEYQAAGLPWTREDMDRGIAPEDNASQAFLDEMGTTKPWLSGVYSEVGDALAKGDYASAERQLNSVEPEIQKFVDASQAKAIAFPKDWDFGAIVLFPEFAKFKSAVKLLAYRAEVKAQQGDFEGAMEDLRAGIRLSHLVGQDSTLISMLVGIACQAITYRGAETIAALRPNDPNWITRVRKETESWECSFGFEQALMGEAYMGLSLARNLPGDKLISLKLDIFEDLGTPGSVDSLYPPANRLVRTGYGAGTIRRAYATRQMETMIGVKKIHDKLKDDPIAMGAELDRYLEAKIKPGKMSDRLAEIVYSAYGQAGFAVAKSRILGEMSSAALRAGAIRARVGKFPTSWAELGIEPILDPVTKEPLKIVVRDGAFGVYSVGLNREDEGGFRNSGRAGDDFGVRFPPPTRKHLSSATSSRPPAPPAEGKGL